MSTVRDHIDAITRRAALEAGVDPNGEAQRELASHLYDLASDQAAGRSVTHADIDEAWKELAPQAIYLLAGAEPGPVAVVGPAIPDDPGPDEPATLPALPPSAPWWLRFLAYLADVATVLAAMVPLIAITIDLVAPNLGDQAETLLLMALMLAAPATLVGMETRRGGTPGKRLLGLKTVTAGGDRPWWGQALLITLPKFLPPLVVLDVVLGVLIAWQRGLRLTERIANVRVVRASPRP